MSRNWKFTAPKVALLVVSGLCAGYWIGRSVGSSEWRILEVGISIAVAAVVLVGCRRAQSYPAPVYVGRSRI
jgi:hypothetical protein